ncbi:MAG: hypothetical protein NVSMB1_15500 [Polyangiales bacterium]
MGPLHVALAGPGEPWGAVPFRVAGGFTDSESEAIGEIPQTSPPRTPLSGATQVSMEGAGEGGA